MLIAVFSQDELLAELDELQELELEKSLPEIGGSENIPLPNVPSTSLPSRPGKSWNLELALGCGYLLFWGELEKKILAFYRG